VEKYIGSKIIRAEEMDERSFLEEFKGLVSNAPREMVCPGYHVLYPDGDNSWISQVIFENAYRRLTDGELELLTDDFDSTGYKDQPKASDPIVVDHRKN